MIYFFNRCKMFKKHAVIQKKGLTLRQVFS